LKAVLTRSELLEALHTVSQAIAKQSCLPILQTVFIDVHEGKFRLIGADGSNQITAQIGAGSAFEGALCVQYDKLEAVVKNLTDELIIIESDDDNKLHITTETGSFSGELFGIQAVDYPVADSVEYTNTLDVECKAFVNALNRAVFAVSHDDSRKALTGVLIDVQALQYSVVGTDGRRMSKTDTITNTDQVPVQIVLQKHACNIIKKVLAGIERATLQFNKRQLCVTVGGVTLQTRLIDAEYPDYSKVIPEQVDVLAICKVNKTDLLKAVGLMGVFSAVSSRTCSVTFDAGSITLESTADGTGKGKTKLIADYEGEPITFLFAPEYLHEAITAQAGNSIQVYIHGSQRPVIFKSLEDPAEYLCLVMPLKKK